MSDDFNTEYIDYSNTKFNKFNITEDIFGDTYEYKCTYDLDIKFHNVNTEKNQFNRLCEKQAFHSDDIIVKSLSERPDCLKDVIRKEDEEEDTVDYAISDWIENDLKRDSQKFDVLQDIFCVDLPKKIFEDAYFYSKYEISSSGKKLKSIEFDYRKPSINKLTLIYDDGSSFTVETNKKITNDDVDNIVPGMTLPEIYTKVDDWLIEDYEGTMDLLKEIFGFDFSTLKGARSI